MTTFHKVKEGCFRCGKEIGYVDNIFNKNYKKYKGKYYCLECLENKNE